MRDKIRLFIAARLPQPLILPLQEAARVLSGCAHSISLVQSAHYHLTLRFLGSVEEEQAQRIRAWFAGLEVPAIEDCTLSLPSYGSFPGREGLILWGGLNCGPGIPAFKAQVDEGLLAFGYPMDDQPFIPHVTLARRARLSRPLTDVQGDLPLHIVAETVPGFVLFESQPRHDGAHYIPLAEHHLV